MAAVIPLIGAFSAVSAAGGIAAAMSTVTGFLSVAGGVLAGVGALTGDKDLGKLGGLMSLGGALGGALGSAAGEAASQTAGEVASEAAREGTRFAEAAAREAMPGLATGADATGMVAAQAPSAQELAGLGGAEQSLVGTDAAPWWKQAAQRIAETGQGGAATQAAAGIDPVASGLQAGNTIADPVMAAAKGMTSSDMQSLLGSAWDKTKQLATGAGQFVRDNKDLLSMVGSAVSPQAEWVDMQKGILARRRANMNSPIRLGNKVAGGL